MYVYINVMYYYCCCFSQSAGYDTPTPHVCRRGTCHSTGVQYRRRGAVSAAAGASPGVPRSGDASATAARPLETS